MNSIRLSSLSAPVSGVFRLVSLLCLALPLLAAPARAASAPEVATIARTQAGPVTLAETLEWRVTFTEAVTGVDLADFELTAVDGAATATLGTVTPGANAAEYFVTATGVAGVGTLRLDVKSSGTGILDAESNALSGGFIHGQPYTRTLGTVPVAWGYNSYGQLGLGAKDYDPHSLPVVVHRTGALAGKTIMAIAAGGSHSLALCSDGTLAAWGWNISGQLGNGLTADSLTPVAVDTTGALAGKTVVTISAGNDYSLALCSDGTVAAWGRNYYGQLGNGLTADSPTLVAVDTTGVLAGKTVVAISAGSFHSLALCSDGTLVSWGVNGKGQLGNGTTVDSRTPVAVGTGALAGKTVVAISAGFMHSLALCSDGTVVAWGFNNYGQLGNDSTTQSPTPVAVITTAALSGKTVVSVAAGTNYSVALCSDGTAAMWGWNTYGQLGDGTTTDRHTPVAVNTASGTSALYDKTVVAITPGNEHLLALCSDGTVAAWGRNYYGQLGNGATVNSPTPLAINAVAGSALAERSVGLLMSSAAASHNFAFVSATPITAVATPAAGTYKLGDTLPFTLTPSDTVTVDTAGGTPRLALTIGAATRYATYDAASSTGTSLVFTYTLATGDTDADGLAVASAIDLNGGTITDAGGWSIALALPAYTLPVIAIDTTPPAVPAITSTAPSGTTASAAYTLTGTAEAGVTVKIYNAGSLVDTVTADAEGHWSCALTLADGATALTVTASDAVGNESAAVADTSWTIDTTAPAVATIARTQPGPVTPADTLEWRVTFTEPVTGVDIADFELKPVDGAATATLGTVTAGANAAEYLVTATGVAGIGTLRLDVKTSGTGIADALGHVMTRGYAYGQSYTHAHATVPAVWGNNNFGQLGLGSSDAAAHSLPAFVPNTGALAGKTVVALSVGGVHTLALTSEGKVYAWGNNVFGQLGNGSKGDPVATPVEVIGLGVTETRKVVAISAGSYHSVALDSDGHVYAWGDNSNGELGNDPTTESSTPVAVTMDGGSALSDKRVVAISAGNLFTLALCSDGTLAAWGFNNNGQLGNGTMANARTPVAVATGSGSALKGKTVVAMAAGVRHSAALCSDGTVATWGNNNYGQLGNGTRDSSSTPVAVSALSGVVAISAGYDFMLALCDDGTRAVWGYNNNGQLGNGTMANARTPVAVATDSGSALYGKTVVALAAGSSHSLALRADGTLATWGLNNAGQLGDGAVAQVSTPKAINDPLNPVAGSALLGRTPYQLAPGCYAYHSAVLVSATPVTAVATPTAGAYKAGDTLSFTLTTKQPVTVTGTPRLALTLGSATVHATYDAAVSTGTSLVFTYTVQAGDTDADGLAVVSTSIDLDGGTIMDAGGWPITLALPAYTLPVISVDAIAPAQLTAFDAVATGAGQIEMTFTAPETCTVYFTALDASQTAGTAAQIVAGQDAAANPVRHGSLALAAGGPGTYTLKGLAAGTAYTVHATVADAAGNVAVALPLVATATTAAAPSLTGMDWSQMTLDALCGEDPQLAFAPDGTPYVAFQSTVVSGKLLVQRYVGGVWSPVGGTSGLSAGPAYRLQLAFAPDGTPYVAYSDNGLDNKAVVKRFAGGAWSAVGPDTGLSYGEVTTLRLAFAPDGTPWLAYSDNTLSDKAVVRRYEQGEWIAVGSGTGVTAVGAATLDLVFGPDGTAHLAFRNSAESGRPAVWFWSEASAAWLTGDTTASLPAVDRVHLAAAPDGTLYLAYCNSSDDKVGVARHDAASWTQIGDSQPASTWLDLAVGADGVPFLCYRKGALGSGYRAYVSTYNGSTWVQAGPYVAAGELSYPSLQIAPDGLPYVVCCDETTGNVVVAKLASAIRLVDVPVHRTYGAGQTLAFTVNYSGPVAVTGTPRLPLTIGSTTRYADYTTTGSTSTALRFLYTVQAGELDLDGLEVGSALDLNGGTIVEPSGWNAGTDVIGVDDCSGIKIDAVAPETTITAQPNNPTANTSATFVFSGNDSDSGVASFEASLDGGAYDVVTSPASFTGLSDGGHTFAVRAIDAAGNVDATPASYTWTVDTTAPDSPVITSLSSTAIGGTAEPGATVEVFHEGTSLGTTTAGADGSWSLTITPLADGDYSLTAQATDGVGNVGTASAAGTYTVDTVAPAAPVVAAAGTGSVTGQAEPGSTVTVYVDGSSAGTAVADATTGLWTRTLASPLTAGAIYSFTATATDAAGNISPISAALTLRIGSSGSTWLVTTNTDVAATPAARSLRFALLHAAAGDTILFALPSGSKTITLAAALPPIMGDLTIDGGTLGDVILDGAGAYRVFFVDTGVVALKNLRIQNALAQGGAGGSGDGGGGGGAGLGAGLFVNQATAVVTVTNVNFISMRAVGGAGGAYLSRSYPGGGGGGMGFRGGQSTSNSGAPGGGGMLAQGGDVLGGGPGGAGGAGGGGGGGGHGAGPGSGGLAYAGNDAGSAGSGENGGAGGFGGGGGGAAVGIGGAGGFGGGGGGTGGGYAGGPGGPGGGGGGSDGNAVAALGGSLGSGVSGGQSGAGIGSGGGGGAAAGPAIFVRLGSLNTVNCAWDTATATGGAGGTGMNSHSGSAGTADATPTFNYGGTVNGSTTTGPIPSALIACTPVLGPVMLVSSNATPTLAKSGDTVTLTFTANRAIDAPTVALGGHSVTATNTSGNVWSAGFTVSASDSEGPVAFSVVFTSTDGFAGTTVTATTDSSAVTIDRTAPDTGITAQPASLSASGTATFTFSSADASASFEASLDGATYASATSPANYTALVDGSHTFAVRAIDAAGNVDATPASYTWTVDTTAPSIPSILSITSTGVSGTAESGSTVEVFNGSTSLGTATADASGNWSLALPLADGSYSLTATSSDLVGNSTGTTAPTTRTVDTAAPAAPSISAPLTTPTSVSGSGEPGSTVRIYDGATLLGSTTVGADGTWTLSLGVLPGGIHTLTAAATDAAGNTGAGQSFRFASSHSGDSDGDWRIGLPELLRMVEMFNTADGAQRTGAYHSAPATAEGFAPGAGPLEYYHSADTDHNGRIDLPELLRAIELYNAMNGTARTGAYHIDSGSADGFSAGAN